MESLIKKVHIEMTKRNIQAIKNTKYKLHPSDKEAIECMAMRECRCKK